MFALLFVFTFSTVGIASKAHNISLLVVAPLPGELTEGWDAGPALIPAARVAADYINNRSDILPGYNVQIIGADSGCSSTSQVTISFLRDIFYKDNQQVVGIIGPACSAAALEVSNLTSRREVSLIHITSATTPQLESQARNTTFAIISSALLYVRSFLELMAYNKWNRVATLQDETRLYFKQTHSRFIECINDNKDNKKVIYIGSLYAGEHNYFIPLDDLKSSRARVVIVFAGSDIAARLLCYAYHKDMLYPNYQWIFHDRTIDQLVKKIETFRVDNDLIGCSYKQMTIATEGVILNLFRLMQEDKDTILPLLQKTYNQYYKEDYKNELEVYRKEKKLDMNDADPYGNTYHDAVWAMAIALHNASMNGMDLNSYTYNRSDDTIKIVNYLHKVSFKGVSGPITFQNDTRSTISIIDIKQIWTGNDTLIGTFDKSQNISLQFLPDAKTITKFITDTYEERQIVQSRVHVALAIAAILLILVLVVVIALLQLANVIWYNYHSIKATSPNISHLIFSGCFLYAIVIILFTMQESIDPLSSLTFAILCNARVWCITLGTSLILGTICAKTWRVYRLFRHFQNESPGRILSDNSLVCFVIFLLFIDLVICIAWSQIDPLQLSIQSEQEFTVRFQCNCRYLNHWLGIISAYKGGIMVLLLFFSVLNRGIKKKDFKHTKKINILIYGITLIVCAGAPFYLLVKSNYNINLGFIMYFAIFSSIILLCCFVLFVPPVIVVLRKKIK